MINMLFIIIGMFELYFEDDDKMSKTGVVLSIVVMVYTIVLLLRAIFSM